jgi:hypothetical protein
MFDSLNEGAGPRKALLFFVEPLLSFPAQGFDIANRNE